MPALFLGMHVDAGCSDRRVPEIVLHHIGRYAGGHRVGPVRMAQPVRRRHPQAIGIARCPAGKLVSTLHEKLPQLIIDGSRRYTCPGIKPFRHRVHPLVRIIDTADQCRLTIVGVIG